MFMMATNQDISKDEDLFHDIVMSEEISQQQGYEAGREIGKKQGETEGQKLGWEKGAAIGSEVGFYAGFAESLLQEMRKDTATKPRTIKTLERMIAISHECPIADPQDPNLHTKLEEVRSKFKQICSQLGIKADFSCSTDVKEQEDTEFADQLTGHRD